jgi:hypothetical protein
MPLTPELNHSSTQMLFATISTAWLTTILMLVAICRMAARGEEAPSPVESPTRFILEEDLIVPEEPHGVQAA